MESPYSGISPKVSTFYGGGGGGGGGGVCVWGGGGGGRCIIHYGGPIYQAFHDYVMFIHWCSTSIRSIMVVKFIH